MNKSKLPLAMLAIVIAGLVGFAVFNDSDSASEVETVEVVEQEQEIVFNDDGTTASYDGVAGQTALEAMQNLTEVGTESSSFGEFVTTINGVEADSNSQYWAFYVNGELASEGAGTYVAADGDTIEWKLESF